MSDIPTTKRTMIVIKCDPYPPHVEDLDDLETHPGQIAIGEMMSPFVTRVIIVQDGHLEYDTDFQ